MSKVQSPKSPSESFNAGEERGRASSQRDQPDVGLRTLDFGLSVTDVRKSFLNAEQERLDVLRSITFSVGAGESVAVMGASGAGKSTLLHLLGGLEAPDHGSIKAGEFAIETAGPSALARFRNRNVGFVFQFHHLLHDLTAAENVSLPLLVRRVHPGEAARLALAALAEIGLQDRASYRVGNLSGGEQQRVAICRALINQPAIVLADEPTGNLDTGLGDKIAGSLVDYAKRRGAIVILATHSQDVAGLCDRILNLRDGRIFEGE
jgi:lipoprotein-releasing system ATP-binding protein